MEVLFTLNIAVWSISLSLLFTTMEIKSSHLCMCVFSSLVFKNIFQFFLLGWNMPNMPAAISAVGQLSSVWLRGVDYIHNVVYLSPLSFRLRYTRSALHSALTPAGPRPAPGTRPLLSVSMIFTLLHVSYKWSHRVFVFLWSVYSTSQMPSRLIHVVAPVRISFLVKAVWYPLAVCPTFSLSSRLWIDMLFQYFSYYE